MEKYPFRKDELNPKSLIPSRPGMEPLPLYHTPITPKENYMRMFHKDGPAPLWIPLVSEIVNFAPRVVPDCVARSFVMDAEGPFDPNTGGGKDMFGTEWVYIPVAGGSMVKPGNPRLSDANDWEKEIQFPDIDSYDWAGAKERNKERVDPERPTLVWFLNGMFERLISFMDFEGAIIALVDEDQQEAVHKLFSRLCDVYEKIIDKYIECFSMDIFYFHDDWGSQRAPFFSIETVREMILPYIKRLVDYCHSKGVIFEFHCCGQVEKLVPAMIEAGIDVWCGQPMNDKAMLHERYGKDIVLGIEPETLPMDATEEQMREAAKNFVEKYGPTMDTAPVYCNLRNCPAKYQDYMYAFGRQFMTEEW